MKFSTALALGLGSLAAAQDSGFTYEKLSKNDSMLLVVDHQTGLYQLARDFDPMVFREAIFAHASIATVFDLPVVMTTSAEDGPNGPLPRELFEMHPNAPVIRRQGEVNAWDNEDFREAVYAANKSQIIISGIVTDVCTTFLALSLREAGFSVWANVEASGTPTVLAREVANEKMAAAGVHLSSMFAIVMELMGDWRNTPGALQMIPWLDNYYPVWGHVARSHLYAITNGTIQDGEHDLNG